MILYLSFSPYIYVYEIFYIGYIMCAVGHCKLFPNNDIKRNMKTYKEN